MNAERRELLERVTRELSDQGKIIEAGWVGLRLVALSPDAPAIQVSEMRMAYMAGAQHLFSSIMTVLDLEAFGRELEARLKTEGRA